MNTVEWRSVTRVLLLLVLSFFLIPGTRGEGDSYAITLRLEGAADTVCYLANYHGDKTYLVDTAYRQEGGVFEFAADSLLPPGIYILAGQSNNKFFEIIVDKQQVFGIEADMSRIPSGLVFEGSSDNTLFYSFITHNLQKRRRIEELRKEKEAPGLGPGEKAGIEEQIDRLFKQLTAFEDSIIAADPGNLVAVILKAKQEPGAGPKRYLPDGSEDSVYAYQSYRKRYWDNLDPADPRLLRTPLYHSRLKNYFEKVLYQHPDTLIREADRFIERAEKDTETFKYVVWYLTYKFETSNIMGFDEVFVHMIDTYYATGRAFWTTPSVVRTLVERADELRQVLIGQPAPDLILLDTAGGYRSLYTIEARYVIVMFYEYGCGHCRKEIAALNAWDEREDYGAEVFAVCTDTNLVEWKKYVLKNKLDWIHVNGTRSITPDYHGLYDISVTPTIYLLDDRKRIIAKRLKTEQLIPFIVNHDQRGLR